MQGGIEFLHNHAVIMLSSNLASLSHLHKSVAHNSVGSTILLVESVAIVSMNMGMWLKV